MQFKALISYFREADRGTKLLVWVLYIITITGCLLYQRDFLLDTYACYGVNYITLICFGILLGLLPYSISRKLNIPIHWYSLIFVPTIVALTLVSIGEFSLIATIVSAIIIAVSVFLVLKGPKLTCSPIVSNLITLLLLIIFTYTFSNTNDLVHHNYKIKHYLEKGEYEKALTVGEKSLSVDSTLYMYRIEAMLSSHKLGSELFRFPIPQNDYLISPKDFNIKDCEKDISLCNLLLDKKLYEFTILVQFYYDINSEELPEHYKEALAIYMHQSVNTDLTFTNATIQNKYAEFLDLKAKETSSTHKNNKCRDQFGDTYFWYYHFFPIKKA